MEEIKKAVGRPRKSQDIIHFGSMLAPDLIHRVRLFKAETGKTINDITAKALDIYIRYSNLVAGFMEPFRPIETDAKEDSRRQRLKWAKNEIVRFRGVETGLRDLIQVLQIRKYEYQKLKWEEARVWHTNDVEEQVKRLYQDIENNETRIGYYQAIIEADGRV